MATAAAAATAYSGTASSVSSFLSNSNNVYLYLIFNIPNESHSSSLSLVDWALSISLNLLFLNRISDWALSISYLFNRISLRLLWANWALSQSLISYMQSQVFICF
ncbi:hypothetical protein Dimus_039113 [Dionaea muscipula]